METKIKNLQHMLKMLSFLPKHLSEEYITGEVWPASQHADILKYNPAIL